MLPGSQPQSSISRTPPSQGGKPGAIPGWGTKLCCPGYLGLHRGQQCSQSIPPKPDPHSAEAKADATPGWGATGTWCKSSIAVFQAVDSGASPDVPATASERFSR